MTGWSDAEKLAGEIAMEAYEEFWAKTRFCYGNPGVIYVPVGHDEFEALGLPTDDPYLTVLRREPDGQFFEIEFEVTARAIDLAPPRQEIPGQLELTEVIP